MDQNTTFFHNQDEDESLWDSPARPTQDKSQPARTIEKHPASARPTYEQQQTREHNLRRELESVRKVNEAIEGVLESLGKAKANMKTVNNTVNAASTLLNTWTRILSQTEHNQRLILDPNWHGASQDIADLEQETAEKQRAVERREAEEQERKSTAARRAEEEEKRKVDATTKQAKPTGRSSSRIGATGRGTSTSVSTSYVQMGGSATPSTNTTGVKRGPSSSRRTTSGISRGGAARGGRGRG